MNGRGLQRAPGPIAGCLLLAVATMAAQAPATSPAFDVVSVKPHASAGGPPGLTLMQVQAGGRFTATNVAAAMMIRNAYQLQTFQLLDAPGWLATERYDVNAKAAHDLPPPPAPGAPGGPGELQLMMRAMLADRFKLKVHTETRELPVYALVLARSDRKLGPKLTPSTTDCAAELAADRARTAAGGAPPPFPAFGEPMKCGMRIGPGTYSAGTVTMAQVATSISNLVSRTVIDRTGLTGNFNFDISFTPEQLPQRAPGAPADQPITINGISIDPNGPSIYTALQEQLGLKLDSTRGPVEVLVIDSVERPTED